MTGIKSHSTSISPSYVPQTTISMETAPNTEETMVTAGKVTKSKGEGVREGRGSKTGGSNPPARKKKPPASSGGAVGNNLHSRAADPTNRYVVVS